MMRQARRSVITADYRVVLSIGDNLGDFVDGYKVSPDARDAIEGHLVGRTIHAGREYR